jgi:hypothetical protein
VSLISGDWPKFRAFVLNADRGDSGASSAIAHLEIAIGDAVCKLFNHEPKETWSPHVVVN